MPRYDYRIILPSVTALFIVLAVGFFGGAIPENLERAWLDRVLRWRAAEYVVYDETDGQPRIGQRAWAFAKPLDEKLRFVEINIDESTAAAFARDGEFVVMADLLKQIASLNPKVIALDILYSVGRESDQQILINRIREIEAAGTTKIVLPIEIQGSNRLSYSLPAVGGESLRSGFVNVEVDEDRMWRRYCWTRQHDGKTIPSLALATHIALLPENASLELADDSSATARWKSTYGKSVEAHQVDGQPFLLNLQTSYFNDRIDTQAGLGRRVWTREAIADMYLAKADFSPLQDAVVFVGFGADFDGKPTAHGPVEPGMLLHATALNDLWHGSALHRTNRATDLWILVGTAIGTLGLFRWLSGRYALPLIGLIGMMAILLGSVVSICFGNTVVPTIAMLGVWVLAFVGELIRRWILERSVRIERDAMLGFYFSPAVLRQVTRDVDMIRPRGGNMAALLSDLRGFTTACEQLSPDDIFALLNRLFAIQTSAALRENGSLRPFMGDQFLAYWGAPETCPDPADRALRSAREIVIAIRQRREASVADALDQRLQIGIGLHFGPAVVGHIGSERYRDYNIMGDLINTAARIESQTKNYDASILATQEFMAALTIPVQSMQLDHVVVKGRQAPVKLFAIDLDPDELYTEERALFTAAFDAYIAGDFAKAAREFEGLASRCKIAALRRTSHLLHDRCRKLATTPPIDWNGIYLLASK